MFPKALQRLVSPKYFFAFASRLTPWLLGVGCSLFCIGVLWGLVYAPADYLQGEGYRILFVHVPSAWLSLQIYAFLGIFSAIFLIWRIRIASILAKASAPIGAAFTFLTLLTGSTWGRPMWGSWWVWDARLTSELILFFLYLAYMTLSNSIKDSKGGTQICAIFALVGLVNLPIIRYSVDWWNTLHQPSSINLLNINNSSIHIDMLRPLLVMVLSFQFFYFVFLIKRAQNEILVQEQNSSWVRRYVLEGQHE